MNFFLFAHPGHEHANNFQAATHHLPNVVLVAGITVLVILSILGTYRWLAERQTERIPKDDE